MGEESGSEERALAPLATGSSEQGRRTGSTPMIRCSRVFRRVSMARLLVSALAGILAAPSAGSAHARLVHASPGDGARLSRAPAELSLCFSELLETQFNAVEVGLEPPAGGSAHLTEVPTTVDPRDGTCLTAAPPPLPPGAYLVRWRVVSRDGHATRGLLHFRVD